MRGTSFFGIGSHVFLATLIPLSGFASPETLNINSPETLEKCYRSEPYLLEQKIDDKKTTKTWMTKELIAEVCTKKASDWAGEQKKNAKVVLEMAETVRRNNRHEEALHIYKPLFSEKANLSHCENSIFYSTLITSLSHPENFPSQEDSDVRRAGEIISLCWAQAAFQKDILDEVDTDKDYVTDNLCRYFRSHKVNLPAKCKNKGD